MHRRRFLATFAASLVGPAMAQTPLTAASAARMASHATAFVAALRDGNRRRAQLAFDAPERTRWRYTPGTRAGLTLGEMNAAERAAVKALLAAALSRAGQEKVTNIIELELVLREMQGDFRDPERYTVAIFGKPGAALWGWRFEGHHLSLNFTVAGERVAIDAPSFFGASPAEVGSGPKRGLRALREEAERAWALLGSLDEAQRSRAVIDTRSYGDIVSGTPARLDPLKPEGLRASDMNEAQRGLLHALINTYAESFADDLREARLARARAGGAETLYFAWAGAPVRGRQFYYRIQGAQFLIEFDASQDGGNHIHTVWRDFRQDFGAGLGASSASGFGRDLLRDHHAAFATSGRAGAHRHNVKQNHCRSRANGSPEAQRAGCPPTRA